MVGKIERTNQDNEKTIKVELYWYSDPNMNDKLTFYIQTKNGEMKEEIELNGQEWTKMIVEYVAIKGIYKPVLRPSADGFMYYVDSTKTTEIPARKLISMIKASKTWTTDEQAKRIVQLLEQDNKAPYDGAPTQ